MQRRTLLSLLAASTLLLAATGAGLVSAREGDEDNRTDDRGGKGRDGKDDRDGDDESRKHGGKPRHGKKGNDLLFQNDHMTVLFKQSGGGKAKPDLRIVLNGSEDDERSGYRVRLLRLYEAEANSTQHHGRLPSINLAKSDDWNVQTTESGDSLTLTMTRAEAQGIVTLVWHVNTTSASIKYDLKVDNWRWAANSTGHRLVLDTLVVGKNLRNATGANVTVEEAGYISWATTAALTYPDGTTGNATVSAHQRSDDDATGMDGEGETGAHLLLAFEAAPGYRALDYDPTFGVQSAGDAQTRGTPGFAPVLVVGAVAVAVLAARRRR